MTAAAATVASLKRRQPEWTPWLSVVEVALRHIASPAWNTAAASVSAGSSRCSSQRFLDHATALVDARAIRRLFSELTQAAAASANAAMAQLERVPIDRFAPRRLFSAAICNDSDYLRAVALRAGVDAEPLRAVVSLLPMPFLQACQRRWRASGAASWVQGSCPVCAAWPSFVEVRGIERQRFARCGRCGCDWHDEMLRCRYCGILDHQRQVTLQPERARSHASVEACLACGHYTKAFTQLQGAAPADVMLHDLDSVELDFAALEEGYTRPDVLAQPLHFSLVDDDKSEEEVRS